MSEAHHHDSALPGVDEREGNDLSIETPAEDAAEQQAPLSPEEDEEIPGRLIQRIPFDADPADAADQEREVEFDEDDYR